MTIYYKLRKKDDFTKYVCGTPMYSDYHKDGRVFHSIGQLRAFLTSVMNGDDRYNKMSIDKHNRVSEWEVVELEVTEKAIKGIHEVITAKKLVEMLKK